MYTVRTHAHGQLTYGTHGQAKATASTGPHACMPCRDPLSPRKQKAPTSGRQGEGRAATREARRERRRCSSKRRGGGGVHGGPAEHRRNSEGEARGGSMLVGVGVGSRTSMASQLVVVLIDQSRAVQGRRRCPINDLQQQRAGCGLRYSDSICGRCVATTKSRSPERAQHIVRSIQPRASCVSS